MDNKDLRFALDSHKANKMRESWKTDLSKACATSINDDSFLDLERTSQLKEAFFSVVKDRSVGLRMCWPTSEREHLNDYLNRLAGAVGTGMAILFSSQDRFFGAVRVPVGEVLRNLFAVWQVVEEDIALTAEDMVSGLCVEKGFYDDSGQYLKEGVYELTAWGSFAL